jgi:hypothetical protein
MQCSHVRFNLYAPNIGTGIGTVAFRWLPVGHRASLSPLLYKPSQMRSWNGTNVFIFLFAPNFFMIFFKLILNIASCYIWYPPPLEI